MRLLLSVLVAFLASCPIQSQPVYGPGPGGPGTTAPPVEEKAADGSACETGLDCASGTCEGQGCGAGQGVCVSSARRCTRDFVPFCGCDGATFHSSSTCPGARYEAPGECTAVVSEPPSPATKLAVGAGCTASEDCESGVCEGQGCGPGQGQCVARDRRCTNDLRQYCGCDGQTFQGSGSCPNRRFAYQGACTSDAAKKPAGGSCDKSDDCDSGICEGQGCGVGQGVCAPKSRMCTRDLRPYCGCDGKTFRSSGTCPGKRYSKRGDC